MQADYVVSSQNEDQAIADVSGLRKTTQFLSGSEAVTEVKSGYLALQGHLRTALTVTFVPSDQANNTREILLSTAQDLEDQLGLSDTKQHTKAADDVSGGCHSKQMATVRNVVVLANVSHLWPSPARHRS
jgi:hypothetical protein